MSNCKHCGAPLDEKDRVCPYCGSRTGIIDDSFDKEGKFFESSFSNTGSSGTDRNYTGDESSFILNAVGFIFPIIGLVIYLNIRQTRPKAAESLKTWVIIGFIKSFFTGFSTNLYGRISL